MELFTKKTFDTLNWLKIQISDFKSLLKEGLIYKNKFNYAFLVLNIDEDVSKL